MTHPFPTFREDGPFVPLPSLGNLRRRDALLTSIRGWFHGNGFHEVETPVRIPFPAPEPNIDCPPSAGAWLRASPELQMKRLLAAGDNLIFQIGPCFRERERGARHNPEFTMLEWYRRGASSSDILDDCTALVRQTVRDLNGGQTLTYRGTSIDVGIDWLFLPVRDAFRRFAGDGNWRQGDFGTDEAGAPDTAAQQKTGRQQGQDLFHSHGATSFAPCLWRDRRPGTIPG